MNFQFVRKCSIEPILNFLGTVQRKGNSHLPLGLTTLSCWTNTLFSCLTSASFSPKFLWQKMETHSTTISCPCHLAYMPYWGQQNWIVLSQSTMQLGGSWTQQPFCDYEAKTARTRDVDADVSDTSSHLVLDFSNVWKIEK